MACHSKCLYYNEESPFRDMCWQSHKIKRVVRSTITAERYFCFFESLAKCECVCVLKL